VNAAKKVLQVHGYEPKSTYLINGKAPFITGIEKIDIFYCNGVLHHIPYADEVLNWALDILNDNGEVRLMLYSDIMWLRINGSESPVEKDIRTERNFEKFVRFGDPVGKYADWYNAEKILYKFGRYYKLVFYSYITSKDYYLVAVLKKRR
jgi:SAM-dependent methyltransferase